MPWTPATWTQARHISGCSVQGLGNCTHIRGRGSLILIDMRHEGIIDRMPSVCLSLPSATQFSTECAYLKYFVWGCGLKVCLSTTIRHMSSLLQQSIDSKQTLQEELYKWNVIYVLYCLDKSKNLQTHIIFNFYFSISESCCRALHFFFFSVYCSACWISSHSFILCSALLGQNLLCRPS